MGKGLVYEPISWIEVKVGATLLQVANECSKPCWQEAVARINSPFDARLEQTVCCARLKVAALIVLTLCFGHKLGDTFSQGIKRERGISNNIR